MIIVDANLLIYAVNADAPDHGSARKWFEKLLSSTENVGLPWVVIMAFIRLTTHPKILQSPLSTADALAYVNDWLRQPNVALLHSSEQHWPVFNQLLEHSGARGNLTTDVHIVALAIENGAAVYSADYDFRRFPEIVHVNPIDTNVLHDR